MSDTVPPRCGVGGKGRPIAERYCLLDHENLIAIVTFNYGFARGTKIQRGRSKAAQILALKQKENPHAM